MEGRKEGLHRGESPGYNIVDGKEADMEEYHGKTQGENGSRCCEEKDFERDQHVTENVSCGCHIAPPDAHMDHQVGKVWDVVSTAGSPSRIVAGFPAFAALNPVSGDTCACSVFTRCSVRMRFSICRKERPVLSKPLCRAFVLSLRTIPQVKY